jgi:hypothetical protein
VILGSKLSQSTSIPNQVNFVIFEKDKLLNKSLRSHNSLTSECLPINMKWKASPIVSKTMMFKLQKKGLLISFLGLKFSFF